MFKPFPLLLSATAILLAYLWYNHTIDVGLPSELLDSAPGILSEDTDKMAATQISRTVIKKVLAIETEEASNSCCDNVDPRLIT